MRRTIFVLSLLTVLLHSTLVWGKLRQTPIYIFGASASFNDSIVYFTNIQILDSAWIDEKTDFLVGRHEYSSQLRSHFNSKGQPARTCLVSFATNEKDIMKKYAKMRKKFKGTNKKPKNYDIREIDEEEFKFSSIVPVTISEEGETGKKAEKNAKKAEKNAQKAKKRAEKMKKKGIGKQPGSDDASNMPPSMPPRH